MTVRSGKSETRGFIIAAAMILPFLLAGCATPYTHLEWGTKVPPRAAAAKPKQQTAHYDYDRRNEYDRHYDRYCDCYVDNVPVPTARPSYYRETARPTHYSDPSYPPPRYSSDMRFSWPVQGRVISEYGSYASGERNDGINIAANRGTPIHAAADGVVSYSGDDLRSYGNLALLKHDNGYVTAYAHADHFIVDKGDHVTRGQIIGYVGSTGDVRGPQLHFELRRGARDPIDPRSMLTSDQVASRF